MASLKSPVSPCVSTALLDISYTYSCSAYTETHADITYSPRALCIQQHSAYICMYAMSVYCIFSRALIMSSQPVAFECSRVQMVSVSFHLRKYYESLSISIIDWLCSLTRWIKIKKSRIESLMWCAALYAMRMHHGSTHTHFAHRSSSGMYLYMIMMYLYTVQQLQHVRWICVPGMR